MCVGTCGQKIFQVAERSLACCLIPGVKRKLSLPVCSSTFDIIAKESEVSGVCRSPWCGKDKVQTFMLIEVQNFEIWCASDGDNVALLLAVIPDNHLPVIAGIWLSRAGGRACCTHLLERCAWRMVMITGTPYAAEADEARTQYHCTHSCVPQFLHFTAEHIFPLLFHILNK